MVSPKFTMVSITNFQKSVPIPAKKIEFAAAQACKHLKLRIPALSIVFVGEARMRRLNREFLGHDYVTDVITFGHGEIVICPRVARANARRFETSVARELMLYVMHGLLHLAGYDDKKPEDIQRMRAKERQLMNQYTPGECTG